MLSCELKQCNACAAILLVAIILTPAATADTPGRILFIGNSLTSSNSGLEAHVQSLAASAGIVMETGRRTSGGWTLSNHYYSSTTINEIRNGNWDVVVLQEQSSRPLWDKQVFDVRAFRADLS